MKIKLSFMEKPSKLNISSIAYNKEIVSAYAQNDTWDIHVFLIYTDGNDGFIVEMCNVPKENKHQTEFDIDFLLDEAISNGPDDTAEFDSLKEAIEEING